MCEMEQGDIVLIDFSYSDLKRSKIRPALVISNSRHFRNFDIAEVIFFRETKSCPVENVLEYVSDRERKISSKTEENYEEICFGCEDVRMHHSDVWLDGYDN
jgi:mRNA-degrading endonuclease toxin of MazEF toxin-antitoxin module